MAAPTFTLKVGDGLGAHIGADEELFNGATVVLEPSIDDGAQVLVDGKLRTIPPVVTKLDADGKLNGTTGIELLADDPSLGLEGTLHWTITVKKARALGFSRTVKQWTIVAGEDGDTIDLATVPPVTVGNTSVGVDAKAMVTADIASRDITYQDNLDGTATVSVGETELGTLTGPDTPVWTGIVGNPLRKVVSVENYRNGVLTDNQIIAAAAADLQAGGILRFGQGVTYSIVSLVDVDLTSKPNVLIDGQGATLNAPSMTGTVFRVRGTSTATTTTLSAAVSTRSRTITVASSAGFAVGDVISIRSDSEFFNPERAHYFKQEMARVAAVPDGTTIVLDARTWNTYSITGHTVTVKRYQPARHVKVRDLNITGPGGTNQTGLRVSYFDGAEVSDVSVDGTGLEGISCTEGINFTVTNGRARRCNYVGHGYGFHATQTNVVKFIGCYGAKNRHSFDVDEVTDLLYLGCTAEADTSAGISTHGNSDVAMFMNNTVRDCAGGIIARGRYNTILYNTILGTRMSSEDTESYKHGIVIGASPPTAVADGVAGIGLIVEGNRVDLSGTDLTTDGIRGIHVAVSMLNARIANNTLKGFISHGIYCDGDTNTNVTIRENELDCSAQAASYSTFAMGIFLTPLNSTTAANIQTDVTIEGNVISGALHSGVRVAGGYATSPRSDKIRIRGNRIGSCGTTPIWLSTGYFGSQVEVYDNETADTKAATVTLANFTKPPFIGLHGYGRGPRPLMRGQESGARMRPNFYYGPEGTTSNGATTLNRLTAVPIFVPRRVTLNRIGINITTAAATGGSQGLLGVYADAEDGYGGYPGVLLASGSVATDSTGFKEAVISVTLNPGLYWLAFVAQTSTPSVPQLTGNNPVVGYQGTGAAAGRNCFDQSSVTGALPDPFTSSPNASFAGAFVQVGVSSLSTL